MDSCFPPLANLSLRGSSRSNKQNKNRHSTDASAHKDSHLFYQNNDHIRNHSEIMPKLEVLQDLDLYYVRQIASSLKVKRKIHTCDPITFFFLFVLILYRLFSVVGFFTSLVFFVHCALRSIIVQQICD